MRWITGLILTFLWLVFPTQGQAPSTEWVGVVPLPNGLSVVLRVNPSEQWVFVHQPTHIYRLDLNDDQFEITAGDTITPLLVASTDTGLEVVVNGTATALEPVAVLDDAALTSHTGNYHHVTTGVDYLVYLSNGALRYATTTHIVRLFPLSDTVFLSSRGETFTFTPEGFALTDAGVPSQAIRQSLYQSEDMLIQNGEIALSGTLYRPMGIQTPPLVIITHGSSPNLRAGYQVEAFWFATRGIATFIYDKRGSGQSGGNLEASLYDLGSDAAAIARSLSFSGPFDTIIVWGLSQGASVSAVAAGQAPDVIDGVIAVSGAGVPFIQQELYRVDRLAADLGYDSRLRHTSLTFWRAAYDLQTATADGQFPDVGFRDALGFEIDLAALWAEVAQPSLIIYGGRDSYVPVMDSAHRIDSVLAENRHRSAQMLFYPEANHGMLVSPTGSSLVFSDTLPNGYVDQMVDWVTAQNAGAPTESNRFEAAESGEFSEGGRYAIPTLVQGASFQMSLLIGLVVVFGAGLLRLRSAWLLGLVSTMGLLNIAGFMYLLVMVIYPQNQLNAPLDSFIHAINPLTAWLTCAVLVVLLVRSPNLYRRQRWGLSIQLSVTLLAGLGYVWWAWYWGMLGLI